MLKIGDWALRQACADAQAWRNAGLPPLRMAVNLSAREFREPRLAERVEAALQETGLDPCALELELSENIIVDSSPATVKELTRLAQAGVHLSVDDYGAAHSSIRWLLTVPIATLKIDRSMICGLPADRTSATVTQALIGLAHGLHLRVVAEGVETQEQLDFVQANEADEVQGYFFSQPLSRDDFSARLRAAERPAATGERITSCSGDF